MGQVRRSTDHSDILRFWWMVELFSPQTVPTVTRQATRPEDRQVIAWRRGIPLPWHSLPEPKPRGKAPRTWRHTVYLGIYRLEATFDVLGRVFGEDQDAYEQAPKGESACAGLLIGDDGRLLSGSPVLSSALWATGRAHRHGTTDPRWMEGFDLAQEQFGEAVDAFEGTRRDACSAEEPLPHTSSSLMELLAIAHDCAGISGLPDLARNHIVIESQAVPRPREGTPSSPEIDFLNSFFLDDLAAVRQQVSHGHLGRALTAYLTDDADLELRERIDIIAHPEVGEECTGATRIPKGRWPADPRHSLALSQQFAVNRALHELGPAAGLMGVNGPPGTGKTTMLRDILAGNVVERARRLSTLTTPTDAFAGEYHWSDGSSSYPRTVPRLIPELTGFEMVVTSANNAAVENVTAEIPAENAIAAPWRGTVDYFKEIASEILYHERSGAWGLIAAKLGRKRNRTEFHSDFWFGDKAATGKSKRNPDDVPRMQERLKMWRDGTAPHTPWRTARQAFKAAERRVDLLLEQRSQAESRIAALRELFGRQRELQDRLHPLRQQAEQARQAVTRHASLEERASSDSTQAGERRNRHLATKPGVLEIIFTLGKAIRRWRSRLEELDSDLARAEQHHQQVKAEVDRLRQTEATARRLLSTTENELADVSRSHARVLEQCQQDARSFGKGYPGPDWEGDQRELHAPWLDAELDQARSDLFIAALQLHEDFIANTAEVMLHGMRAACEIVAGRVPIDLEPEKILAAWQLFFLVVPLVSSTFASASRMFGGLGPESIGWLLIDEAGQAAPQLAVGAIWRARRVIAVGDPLQLEPVVTIPEKAIRNIAVKYGVDETWLPTRASVQTLADRVTRHGTVLDQGEEQVWVSAPLRVHRRCDDPMFSFCNRIAYNDLMVSGVQRVLDDPAKPDLFDSLSGPRVTPSRWIHIPSGTSGSHLQQNQIEELQRALGYLTGQGIPLSDVFAISPFRLVADALRSLRFDHPGLKAGTIHTAQGQEAAVVFLVLGGDPAKPGSPAMWSRSPNLINVAVSRAKRRIYVIGDLNLWGRQNYFKDLNAMLRPGG